MKIRIFLALAVISATSAANAAITVLSGGTGSFITSGSYPKTALSSFDASSASKIVFTMSTEVGFGDTAFSSVTFGGNALVPAIAAVNSTNSIQQTSIYYLDASSVSGGSFGTGDLVINGSGSNDFGVSWIFLSGTADGVGPTNSATNSLTVSLTTTLDNSFVVASHASNGSSGTAQSPLTALLDGDVGSAGGGSGYATITTAGSGSYSFAGSTSRPVTVVAAFAPIPEPATALLGSLGALLLLRRRR